MPAQGAAIESVEQIAHFSPESLGHEVSDARARSKRRGRRLVVAAVVPIQAILVLLLSGCSVLDFYAIGLGDAFLMAPLASTRARAEEAQNIPAAVDRKALVT